MESSVKIYFGQRALSANIISTGCLGYLPTDFCEIQNADILDREGSVSNNKITSS
jgi:hypothetical protein